MQADHLSVQEYPARGQWSVMRLDNSGKLKPYSPFHTGRTKATAEDLKKVLQGGGSFV